MGDCPVREPCDWEEEDIEALIHNHVQESFTLDYKRSEALDNDSARKKELSKDVSAFANSAGGVLVYGVIEEKHLPAGIDDGYDPRIISREWIEHVINSNIQRHIDGIRIKQIELKKRSPGRVIYVVSVPQSKRAPHMANGHIFYKRHNFESIPMEEYEVRDVARRDEVPDLHLELSLPGNERELTFGNGAQSSEPIEIQTHIRNRAITPAMYYIAAVLIDERITVSALGDWRDGGEAMVQVGGEQVAMRQFHMNCAVPHKLPIWQGEKFLLTSKTMRIAVPRPNADVCYSLAWFASAPGMGRREGIAFLKITGNTISLEQLE